MSQGIQNVFITAASQDVANATLVTATGMTIPIAANQQLHLRLHLTFSVGATGGCRFQLVVPSGGVSFNADFILQNTVAPAQVVATQPASAAFTNALANAGTHFIDIEAHIVNGATAGSVTLQFAQSTTNATPISLFRGGRMQTIGGPY